MVRKSILQEKPHYLDEHLAVRPDWDAARLARELGTSETNVSRWRRYQRELGRVWRRKIEDLWKLPTNGLLDPPGEAKNEAPEAFLAGLSEASQHILTQQRDFLRRTEATQAPRHRRR